MKLTKEAAESFATLRGSPDFQRILKWLEEYRTEACDRCCTAEGTPLHRAQGEVLAVNNILKGYEKAPVANEKFKTKP